MDGALPGALHDRRRSVKAWAVMADGTITGVWIDELIARRNADLDFAMGVNAWVEPVTLTWGHEPDKIRDVW